MLDLMAPHFKEIVCVFMFFVDGLSHVERYLNWAKRKYPNITILKVPHWNLTYILRSGTFCVPNPSVKLLKLADIDEAIRLKTGIEYSFFGMKKSDSLNRRLMLNSYGAIPISNTNKIYPLASFTNKEILAYIKMKNLPNPVRYSKNASGGLGFNLECFLWMKDNAPEDLQKILKAFPMSEVLLYKYKNNQLDE